MNDKQDLINRERQEQREEDFKEVLSFFLFCATGITIVSLILIYIGVA